MVRPQILWALASMDQEQKTGEPWLIHVLPRALNPSIAFANINMKAHTASLWANGTHKLSWTTLAWAAEGIAQILQSPAQTANKVVPIRAFEASQADIVSALEKAQGTAYAISHVEDPDAAILRAQTSWKERRDGASALLLVKAGFFLDGYGSNFITEGSAKVGNEFLPDLPKLQFDDVIAEVLETWA